MKILVTGSNSRFGKILRNLKSTNKLIFRDKRQLNILSTKSIRMNLQKYRPQCVLHLAGLSRPMSIHESDISKSIDLNIVGTSNLVKEVSKINVKLIYLSTNYLYKIHLINLFLEMIYLSYKQGLSKEPQQNLSYLDLSLLDF